MVMRTMPFHYPTRRNSPLTAHFSPLFPLNRGTEGGFSLLTAHCSLAHRSKRIFSEVSKERSDDLVIKDALDYF